MKPYNCKLFGLRIFEAIIVYKWLSLLVWNHIICKQTTDFGIN